MKKKFLSLALALVLCLGLSLPAAAFDMGKAGTYNTVSTAVLHTGAIDQNGSLWMWGNNKYGQLGNGSVGEDQTTAVNVLNNVVSVSCGGSHTAAIKADGSLWMWGDDKYGQIGVGGNVKYKDDIFTFQYVPVKVMDSVVAVSCGGSHTAAIKTDGSLWMWGSNSSGQIGNGGGGNAQKESGLAYQNVPVKIMDNVAAVSCGGDDTAAIKTDGSLWMWGNGSNFKLGNGLASNIYDTGVHGENLLVPTKIMDGVTAVSCGGDHTAAIKTDGSLWVWGDNTWYQLGNGGTGDYKTGQGSFMQISPMKIMDGVTAVTCTADYTAAVKADGSLWTWGYNTNSLLGNGDKGNFTDEYNRIYQTVPTKVLDGVATASCGSIQAGVIKADGTLWIWGSGPLGNGTLCKNIPQKVMENMKVPETSTPSTPAAPSGQTAQPSTDKLTVDGKSQVPTAYKIGGNNYFKLRDVAAMLNGTSKQFSVGYDGSVILTTGQPYQSVGGELSGPASGSQSASVSNNVVYINGVKAELTAYQIGGNNYFKLRDLGKALNFYVGWSQERGVYIETDKPYQD